MICEGTRFEQGGRSFFALRWEDEGGYVREALEAGRCSFFLPTRFLRHGDKLTAYYDDTDYRSLLGCFEEKARRGGSLLWASVSLARQLAEGEEEAQDFLLNTDGIRYGCENIFLSAAGRPALAYIPHGSPAHMPFSLRIQGLMNELDEAFPGLGADRFAQKLAQELEKKAMGTGALLRLFSRWEREI